MNAYNLRLLSSNRTREKGIQETFKLPCYLNNLQTPYTHTNPLLLRHQPKTGHGAFSTPAQVKYHPHNPVSPSLLLAQGISKALCCKPPTGCYTQLPLPVFTSDLCEDRHFSQRYYFCPEAVPTLQLGNFCFRASGGNILAQYKAYTPHCSFSQTLEALVPCVPLKVETNCCPSLIHSTAVQK